MATGFGMVPVRHQNGSPYTGQAQMYYMPSTDGSDIGLYECMKLVNAMDTPGEVSVVAQAAAGDALIGVMVGIVPTAAVPLNKVYRPASTGCYVLIADDPDLIFQIQEDVIGGAVSAASIGSHFNASIIVASATANADTNTGMSKTMLDSSTAAATSLVLKILGVKRDGQNVAAQAAGAVLECKILLHALVVTDSIT